MSDATRDDELGALWIKSGARGDYMTGTINGVAVVVFPNDRKAPGSKQPDWRVLKPKSRGEAPTRPADDPPVHTDDDLGF